MVDIILWTFVTSNGHGFKISHLHISDTLYFTVCVCVSLENIKRKCVAKYKISMPTSFDPS